MTYISRDDSLSPRSNVLARTATLRQRATHLRHAGRTTVDVLTHLSATTACKPGVYRAIAYARRRSIKRADAHQRFASSAALTVTYYLARIDGRRRVDLAC